MMNDRKYRLPLFIMVVFTLLSIDFSATALADQKNDLANREKVFQMYRSYKRKSFPNVPDITVEKLLQWKTLDKPIIVDVRDLKERRVSIIPGAIPKDEFEKNLGRYKKQKIVVYCTIGYRSGRYVKKLRRKNLDAFNLIGGVLAWSHAGQIFDSPDGDSLRVHVYGKKWNLLPARYHPVW